jgi:hypothetical protein
MWYTCCENAKAIEALYSVPPDLSLIELHEVLMQRDGPRLQLRFDLPVFPDRPPPRWSDEATVAQATVDFWGVSNLRLEGWETSNRGELTVERLPDGVLLVAFESPVSSLHCRCSLARIASVTAYAQEAE